VLGLPCKPACGAIINDGKSCHSCFGPNCYQAALGTGGSGQDQRPGLFCVNPDAPDLWKPLRCSRSKTIGKHRAKQNATFPLSALKTNRNYADELFSLLWGNESPRSQKLQSAVQLAPSALQSHVVHLPCAPSQDRSHLSRQLSSLKESFCIVRHSVQQSLDRALNSSKTDQASGKGCSRCQERKLRQSNLAVPGRTSGHQPGWEKSTCRGWPGGKLRSSRSNTAATDRPAPCARAIRVRSASLASPTCISLSSCRGR